MHKSSLQELLSVIGYPFRDISLLETAILHPSVNSKYGNYERMEFLGDSILGFVISELLYHTYVEANEGVLAKMHSFLISGKKCAAVGNMLRLADFIVLSPGAEKNNERLEETNIANVTESIIAAIYLDGGMICAREFILKNWTPFLQQALVYEDPKSRLQQISQEKYKSLPIYELIETKGLDHAPIFEIRVRVAGFSAMGSGKNKKSAEQSAAENMLSKLI